VTRAKSQKTQNSKLEIRNSKQIQIFKNQKLLNQVLPDYCFGFARRLGSFGFGFVSNFDIRISDLFRYSEQFFAVILNDVKDLLLVSGTRQILRRMAPQNDIQL
jgi:hypothetical protein